MLISNKSIVGNIAGILIEMAPYHKVPNLDKIINVVLNNFNNITSKNKSNIYAWDAFDFETKQDLHKFIKDTLMSIDEFKVLNVSPARQKQGFTYETQEDGFVCVGRGIPDIPDEHDFVDLDAAIGNIYLTIWNQAANDDCFLCEFSEKYGSSKPGNHDFCNYCTCNWSTDCKVKSYRKPHPWSKLPRNSEEYQKLVAEGKIKDM